MTKSMTIRMVLIFSLMVGATWVGGTWGCGSSSGGGGGGGGGGGDETTNTLSVAFPDYMVVSSVTASESSEAALQVGLSKNQEGEDNFHPMPFEEKKELVGNLLNPPGGELPPIPPEAVNFEKGAPPMECYGPSIYHSNGGQNPLPPYDTGYWLGTEPDTGEACAAAVMNSTITDIERAMNMVIMTTAATFGQAGVVEAAAGALKAQETSDLLPAPGGETDLKDEATTVIEANALPLNVETFKLARDEEDTGDGKAVYRTDATGTISQGPIEEAAIEMNLTYIPDDAENTKGCGRYSMKMALPADELNEMNFQGCDGRTQCISISFCKNSEGSITYLLKKAEYCGGFDVFDDNGECSTVAAVDQEVGPPPPPPPLKLQEGGPPAVESDGWRANFFYILAELNESDGTGTVLQQWIAGHGDALGRNYNVEVVAPAEGSSAKTGCGYFGYGPRLDAEGFEGPVIDRMVCNWAGPNGAINSMDYTGVPRAQKMCFTEDSDGKFVSDEDDPVNITYAPVTNVNDEDPCDKAAGTYAYGTTEGPPWDVDADADVISDLIPVEDVYDDITVPDLPSVPAVPVTP